MTRPGVTPRTASSSVRRRRACGRSRRRRGRAGRRRPAPSARGRRAATPTPSTAASAGTPASTRTARAARALLTLNAPGSRTRAGTSTPGPTSRKRAAVGAQVDVLGPPVRVPPERDGGHQAAVQQPAAGGVVGVDHPAARPLGREQRRLGGLVLLERGVEVQVVLGEVGEGGDVEDQPVDPAQRQRVAADLHRHRGDPPLAHDREQAVQVGSLRRGAHARQHLPRHPGLDRAEQPGGAPRRPQAGLEQERRRRLAVGAGDAEQQQVVAGPAVHARRHLAEHGPRVGGDEDRHADGRAARPPPRRR